MYVNFNRLKVKVLVAQSCLTLGDPMDSSQPGSSVQGILQARILEWVAIPFSRVSSSTRDQTRVSRIAGNFFTVFCFHYFTCFFFFQFFPMSMKFLAHRGSDMVSRNLYGVFTNERVQENKQKLFNQKLLYSKSQSPHLYLRADSQVREWEMFMVEKRKTSGVFKQKLLAGESQRQANSKEGIYVIDLILWTLCLKHSTFDFLRMVLSWKEGWKLGKLAVIDQVLITWGQLSQRLQFCFWAACCKICVSEFFCHKWSGHS